MWNICNIGGGISNSQIITEEGKYALDAVQNNPDIEGSLRNELNRVSDKVDRQIINAWNDFDTNITGGYIKLIRIRVLSGYADTPLRFTINGRGFDEPLSLVVRFNNSSSLDANVGRYVVKGAGSNNYKFYIAKETTGIWDIYAQHTPYRTVFVTQAEYGRYIRSSLFEVTYPNVFVDSLPDGSLEFTTE